MASQSRFDKDAQRPRSGGRRLALAAMLAAGLLGLSGKGSSAAEFPTRPVTLIVPWPAGGTTDVSMRVLAEAAQKHLGQPIIVENKPGATGLVGPAHPPPGRKQ